MLIQATTFEFEIDDRFTGLSQSFESGSTWAEAADEGVQTPMFHFALSEVVDLMEEFGEGGRDYDQALLAYFDTKRPGVVSYEDETLVVGGFAGRLRRSISKRAEAEVEVQTFHLFVNLRLDGEFMQEFSADCPLGSRETYEPLFLAALASVQFRGDRRAAIDAQEAARAPLYAKLEALETKLNGVRPTPGLEAPESSEAYPVFTPADDQQPHAQVDGKSLVVEASWLVASHSHELLVRFEGSGIDPTLRFLEERSQGTFCLSVGLKGAHGPGGVPRGSYLFQEGRCEKPYLNFRVEGCDYRLRFSGRLSLDRGWAALQGVLDCSYEANLRFEVSIVQRLDPSGLDWSAYQYTTRGELACADPDQVRLVFLSEPATASSGEGPADAFPRALLDCANLETLTIQRRSYGEAIPMVLPEAIGSLERLSSLQIGGFDLGRLPASLGGLRSLSRLSLNRCSLREAPPEVWRLPALESLYLEDNELEAIPDGVLLPKLRLLSLRNNRLQSLPDGLVEGSKLERLILGGNPWASLPDACNRLKVELPIGEKRRLLDFEYPGADGQGLVSWDDEIFFARSNPALLATVEAVLGDERLGGHGKTLGRLLKHAVVLQHEGPESYARIGGHRAGGRPDLPASIPYPRFGSNDREGKTDYAYEFLVQLNLDELAPLQGYLPRRGMLYFFLTTIHDVYGSPEAQAAKVLHFSGPQHELASGRDISLERDDFFEMMGDGYGAFELSAAAAASSPSFYGIRRNLHVLQGDAVDLAELEGGDFLSDLAADLFEEPINGLVPHAHSVGGYAFTQNEDPESSAALAWKGDPKDWMILLRIGSRGDFSWGDAGELFFVIHKSDLVRGDFSRVFCTMESS